MNLDDFSSFTKLDPRNLLGEIDGLPDQLEKAWALGQTQPLPETETLRQIVLAGMGGSAIGADLLAAYAAGSCPLPVFVHRDYGLPAFAAGRETLVIVSSHSGNTEEALDSFDTALEAGCSLVAVCTGGKLEEKAAVAGVPVWKFDHPGQPRAAVGYSFSLLLAAFTRLGLVPDPDEELAAAAADLREGWASLRAEVPVVQNPAKRLAGQLVGRWVNVFGAGLLAPVARRWKTQMNELAKAAAGFEILPEADHNTLAGSLNPVELLPRSFALFLRAPSDHPRNRLRLDLTRQALMVDGMNTDHFDARGEAPLAHLWTALHFGDYTAYYLAMAYGVDPTPVEALENFKAAMRAA